MEFLVYLLLKVQMIIELPEAGGDSSPFIPVQVCRPLEARAVIPEGPFFSFFGNYPCRQVLCLTATVEILQSVALWWQNDVLQSSFVPRLEDGEAFQNKTTSGLSWL